jgi:hypothetical protein
MLIGICLIVDHGILPESILINRKEVIRLNFGKLVRAVIEELITPVLLDHILKYDRLGYHFKILVR